MSVGTQIFVVRSKYLQRFTLRRKQVFDGAFPRTHRIVRLHIPQIVCKRIERNLRTLGILHWVAHKTREIVCNVKPIAIGGTEEKMVAHKVIDGEVEPNVAFATDALVDPVHPFLLDGVHHAVARPHHLDARTKVLSQSVEINISLAAPCAVVDGGAEQEWRNITVFSHKRRVNVVEQFRLFFCTRTFA